MQRPLAGRSILLVEDEPLVALDVTQMLERAGARVICARTLADALEKADEPTLAAAVLDHGLRDTDTSDVCEKLKQRGIPFVLYSGYSNIEGACSEGKLVQKPAHPQVLVATLVGVVQQGRPLAH
jgi:DNA-binding response OmpR family regulator